MKFISSSYFLFLFFFLVFVSRHCFSSSCFSSAPFETWSLRAQSASLVRCRIVSLTDESRAFFYSAKARSWIFVEGEISTIFRLSDGVVMVAEPSSFVGVNKIYISGFFREASKCVEATSEMRCECSSYTCLRGCHLHVVIFCFQKANEAKSS